MSGRFTITLTPQAEDDLREIVAYIAADSPGNARAFLDRVLAAIDSLERFPRRHPVARESQTHGGEIRQVNVSSYRVLFSVQRRSVSVLRIGHGSRQSLPPQGESP